MSRYVVLLKINISADVELALVPWWVGGGRDAVIHVGINWTTLIDGTNRGCVLCGA